jgi:hypothetical protein
MTEAVSRGGRQAPGFALGDPTACAALPSGPPAVALVSGDLRALPAVLGTTVARAALIATGLIVAGERTPARLVKNAVAGSLAIEAFVIGWAAWKLRTERGASP